MGNIEAYFRSRETTYLDPHRPWTRHTGTVLGLNKGVGTENGNRTDFHCIAKGRLSRRWHLGGTSEEYKLRTGCQERQAVLVFRSGAGSDGGRGFRKGGERPRGVDVSVANGSTTRPIYLHSAPTWESLTNYTLSPPRLG